MILRNVVELVLPENSDDTISIIGLLCEKGHYLATAKVARGVTYKGNCLVLKTIEDKIVIHKQWPTLKLATYERSDTIEIYFHDKAAKLQLT
ncbi:hypothetical protein [Endozoicomonas sp. ONNA1]|uniref:hypothetical protein n=1 Tax=Endozoicomonas sp. ONNA1 TaxID=2828740 RepID=UPI00214988CE|nr:hypothetical protein [Endozoicomonas sp. ONNA1]